MENLENTGSELGFISFILGEFSTQSNCFCKKMNRFRSPLIFLNSQTEFFLDTSIIIVIIKVIQV